MQTECAAAGGAFNGEGTLCTPSPCLETKIALATKDVIIRKKTPGLNFCTVDATGVGYSAEVGQVESLYSFDLSAIPAGATVVSATFTPWVYECSAVPADGTVEFDWGSILGSWTECSVTWSNAPAYHNMVSPGSEGCASGYRSLSCSHLVATVQSWVSSPSGNYGIRILSGMGTTQGGLGLGSHRLDKAAKLTVHYRCP